MKITSLIALIVIGTVAIGCDGGKPEHPANGGSSGTTRPTASTNVPQTQPMTNLQPASSQPVARPASVLYLNSGGAWHAVAFPPAMLWLANDNGQITARLFSDDPRSMLTSRTAVDSYDLEMKLDGITDVADLDKAVWQYKSPSSQQQETPYGIHLRSTQQLLQPLDAQVIFTGQPPLVQVTIAGKFWLYSTNPNDIPAPPPEMVDVKGVVAALVPEK